MFNFLDDIEKLTKLPFQILKDGFRIINYSNKCVYIENYKKILSFSKEEITIKISKGILTVSGKCLTISGLNISSIIIQGDITLLKVE